MRKFIKSIFGVKEKTTIEKPSAVENEYWRWVHSDFSQEEHQILEKVEPHTMTSKERLINLIRGTEYVINNNIEGDFVECGVWKGGSSMAMALVLNKLKREDRKLYLYDTFEGMSEPSEIDVSIDGQKADIQLKNSSKNDQSSVWCYSALEEVQSNMAETGYPSENIRFIQGKVEETIPLHIPEKIALLRLDTDWYESTKHELEYLFPRLQKGGLLIIDDYGHWQGCRQAVDEYIKKNKLQLFLTRVDYTGRMAVK